MGRTKLTEQEIRDHFKHMCESGYDPLLCIERTFRVFDTIKHPGQFKAAPDGLHLTTRKVNQFIDRVITADRYVELITNGIERDHLDDIIFIDPQSFLPIMGSCIGVTSAIFWLYPNGCRTLTDLYNRYEKKIKDELAHHIST